MNRLFLLIIFFVLNGCLFNGNDDSGLKSVRPSSEDEELLGYVINSEGFVYEGINSEESRLGTPETNGVVCSKGTSSAPCPIALKAVAITASLEDIQNAICNPEGEIVEGENVGFSFIDKNGFMENSVGFLRNYWDQLIIIVLTEKAADINSALVSRELIESSGSKVTVKLPGDADHDGDVDGDDNLIWQSEFGSTTGGAADADMDGDVDGNDFLFWQTQFGKSIFNNCDTQ